MLPHSPNQPIRGRGAATNLANRFDRIEVESDPNVFEDERPSPTTKFYKDQSRSIISYNTSPDIGFDASINPYRGCEHGCVYCYARPTHEYYGMSLGIDFESKIIVKQNAPDLLRKELSAKKWVPQLVAISGVTDCYQPVERKLKLTRQCLEVLLDFRNPCAIVTKNHLVTRDIDLLQQMAEYQCAAVFVSINSLDKQLVSVMEPRTSRLQSRLKAIRELSDAGIPTGVMVAPVIPGLNDHEIPSILEAAKEAGAQSAKYILLRLPYGVKELFTEFVAQHYPNHTNKIINRIKHIRNGKLNNTEFGERFRGQGIFAEQIEQIFSKTCKRLGLNQTEISTVTDHFRIPQDHRLQQTMF